MSRASWTPERKALVAAEYADDIDSVAFLAKVNELPGPEPVPDLQSLQHAASSLGIKKTHAALSAIRNNAKKPEPRVQSGQRNIQSPWMPNQVKVLLPPPPSDISLAEQEIIADRAAADRYDLALKMLRRRIDPDKVRAQTKLPLREVFRLMAKVREGKRV